MKYYGQQEEDRYLLSFFGDKIGRLLDIGAYHPEVFSNSRNLILKGWDAVLVEPSPQCFKNIEEFYKDTESVETVQVAIGSYDGKLKFHDSGGAIATAHQGHYDRWKHYETGYTDITVDCVTWRTFYNSFPGIYDFINIDCEGMDWEVLQQIDLDETGTDLVCIEYGWNTKEIKEYLLKSGFSKIFFMSGENLIVGR